MTDDASITAEQFVALLVRHEHRVRSFVATLMLPSAALEDVLQEAFLIAWRKMAAFRYSGERPDEEFVRWVCTISKYEVLAHFRKQRANGTVAFGQEIIELLAEAHFRHTKILDDRTEALADCVEKLATQERRVIVLRYSDDWSVEKIAKEFDRTSFAIYKSLAKIRKKLMSCIQRQLSREQQ